MSLPGTSFNCLNYLDKLLKLEKFHASREKNQKNSPRMCWREAFGQETQKEKADQVLGYPYTKRA